MPICAAYVNYYAEFFPNKEQRKNIFILDLEWFVILANVQLTAEIRKSESFIFIFFISFLQTLINKPFILEHFIHIFI